MERGKLGNWKGKSRSYTGSNLVTWNTPRCIVCGRFLSKLQRLYCYLHKEYRYKLYYKKNKSKVIDRAEDWKHNNKDKYNKMQNNRNVKKRLLHG